MYFRFFILLSFLFIEYLIQILGKSQMQRYVHTNTVLHENFGAICYVKDFPTVIELKAKISVRVQVWLILCGKVPSRSHLPFTNRHKHQVL